MNGRSRTKSNSPSSYTSLRPKGQVRAKWRTWMNLHSARRRPLAPRALQRWLLPSWQGFVWRFLYHRLVLSSRTEIKKRQLWRKSPLQQKCACVHQVVLWYSKLHTSCKVIWEVWSVLSLFCVQHLFDNLLKAMADITTMLLNSQSVIFTFPQEDCGGAHAWINVIFFLKKGGKLEGSVAQSPTKKTH